MEDVTTGNSPEAQVAPAVESVVSSDVNFLSSLPEDMRSEASLQDFKDIGGLAKSYVSSQQMLGSSVRIPGEDAGDDQRTEFYNKLQSVPGVVRMPTDPTDSEGWSSFYSKAGKPETAEGYQLNMPDGMEADKGMLDMAHSMGLNNQQVNKFVEYQTAQQEQSETMQIQSRENAHETLKQTWGQDYDNRMDGAKAAIRSYSEKHPDAVNELINGPAGNNPALLMMLSDLHGNMQEKGIPGTQASNISYGVTPSEALAQIEEIRGNSQHAAFNSSDPAHKAAVTKMTQLYNIAYSG